MTPGPRRRWGCSQASPPSSDGRGTRRPGRPETGADPGLPPRGARVPAASSAGGAGHPALRPLGCREPPVSGPPSRNRTPTSQRPFATATSTTLITPLVARSPNRTSASTMSAVEAPLSTRDLACRAPETDSTPPFADDRPGPPASRHPPPRHCIRVRRAARYRASTA